jgi:membrane protein YqaA with SNARE-associated domain
MFSTDEFNSKFLAIFSLVISIGILLFTGTAMLTGLAKSDDPVAMLVVGGLLSNFGLVVGYWFGSSASSKRNADRLTQERQAKPQRKVRATDIVVGAPCLEQSKETVSVITLEGTTGG